MPARTRQSQVPARVAYPPLTPERADELGELFRTYRHVAFGVARGLAKHDRGLAEDLVQEAATRLLHSIIKGVTVVKEPDHFRALWCKQVHWSFSAHVGLARVQREELLARLSDEEIAEYEEFAFGRRSRSPSAENEVMHRMGGPALAAAGRLPLNLRRLLVLGEMEGYGSAELAQLCGYSSAVCAKTMLSAARRRLREEYADLGGLLPARPQASSTRCARGHDRTAHGYLSPKGHWSCRACARWRRGDRAALTHRIEAEDMGMVTV